MHVARKRWQWLRVENVLDLLGEIFFAILVALLFAGFLLSFYYIRM
jgi:hypothetical protein